jgi:hypothetical protein
MGPEGIFGGIGPDCHPAIGALFIHRCPLKTEGTNGARGHLRGTNPTPAWYHGLRRHRYKVMRAPRSRTCQATDVERKTVLELMDPQILLGERKT